MASGAGGDNGGAMAAEDRKLVEEAMRVAFSDAVGEETTYDGFLPDPDPEVEQELDNNSATVSAAGKIASGDVVLTDQDPITQEMIDEIMRPILEFPTELMDGDLAEMIGVVEASDLKHKDFTALGEARILEERKLVADLAAELEAPNKELRSVLDERKEMLKARRAKLEERKAGETAADKFEARKRSRLAFHREVTDQYTNGDTRTDLLNELEEQIAQLYNDMETDQAEQNAYLDKARDLMRVAADNRKEMVERLNEEVLPSIKADALQMKQTIAELSAKNTQVITEGRRQLMDKKDQISLVIDGQTAKIRGLQYTLEVLTNENTQLETLKQAQHRQRTDNTLRLRRLKEGVFLDKFHTHRPGKKAQRWLQLSEDGNFLYYAADVHLKKKFKKFRVSELSDVFLGPCTSTFRFTELSVAPTNVFSLVFKDGTTLDFHCKSSDTLEAVFLGLQDLSQLYDTSRLPVFTSAKLRWMRYSIRAMMPRGEEVHLDDFNLRRQYLRRMFGYHYYESRFERLQAKKEEKMHDAREIFHEETNYVRDAKASLVEGELNTPAVAGYAKKGLVSDSIRAELNRNSFMSQSIRS